MASSKKRKPISCVVAVTGVYQAPETWSLVIPFSLLGRNFTALLVPRCSVSVGLHLLRSHQLFLLKLKQGLEAEDWL